MVVSLMSNYSVCVCSLSDNTVTVDVFMFSPQLCITQHTFSLNFDLIVGQVFSDVPKPKIQYLEIWFTSG